MDLPHRCGQCAVQWSGSRTCHCSAAGCHQTFSSPAAFEQHRLHGECHDPASRKLILRQRAGYEVWGEPGDDERLNRLHQ